MADTIRTQHPRCPTCKTRLNIDGRCLHCRPFPPTSALPWRLVWLAVAGVLIGFGVWLLSGCCTVACYNDGSSARPFYRVQRCPGKAPVVLDDSPTRYAPEKCR